MPIEAKHLIRWTPLVLLLLAAFLLWLRPEAHDANDESEPHRDREYAGSRRCASCHPGAFEAWSRSHHALAERTLDSRADKPAFTAPDGSPRLFEAGELRVALRERTGRLEIASSGPEGSTTVHSPIRVIGVEPLWQLVTAAPRGRYQVTSFAYDPAQGEWFDATASQNWKPGEWGFWTGRGMTWNSMCAPCHTTRYEKNYDPATDSYNSEWLELGVGCEACHGPSLEHAVLMEKAGRTGPAPTAPSGRFDPKRFREGLAATREDDLKHAPPAISADRIVDTCGACHARRADLTGDFVAGDEFLDHFRPDLPDLSDIFWPDGQVREEDYEYASFLSSRMHLVGVRCVHCHEPHSGELRAEGNALCMSCHEGRIDPASHSHHPLDAPGGRCVDCHMPVTVYMERHPRRDHGFTIPDPLLSREHGIPNACNRCHDDRTPQWADSFTREWYGETMNRPTRDRARALARAKKLDATAVPNVLAIARNDSSPFWRAVATGFLAPWAHRDDVASWLVHAAENGDPLTRSRAVRSIEAGIGGGAGILSRELAEKYLPVLAARLDDPVRAVRLEAAWALRLAPAEPARPGTNAPPRFIVEPGMPAGDELERYLRLAADQPAGLLQQATLRFERGEVDRSIPLFRRAAEWHPTDAQIRRALAVALSARGDTSGALALMREAHRLAPEDPSIAVGLGLALAESGDLEGAEDALREACSASPPPPRAWYNLAHVLWKRGHLEPALDAITTAIEIDPTDPDALETRSALHGELGQESLAREFARRASEARESWRQSLAR